MDYLPWRNDQVVWGVVVGESPKSCGLSMSLEDGFRKGFAGRFKGEKLHSALYYGMRTSLAKLLQALLG